MVIDVVGVTVDKIKFGHDGGEFAGPRKSYRLQTAALGKLQPVLGCNEVLTLDVWDLVVKDSHGLCGQHLRQVSDNPPVGSENVILSLFSVAGGLLFTSR